MPTRREFLTRVGHAGGFGAAFLSMRGLGLMAEVEAVPLDLTPGTGAGTKVVILGGGIGGVCAPHGVGEGGFGFVLLAAAARPRGPPLAVRDGPPGEPKGREN